MAPLGGRVLVIEVGDDRPCFHDVQKSLDEGRHLKSGAHFKSSAIFRQGIFPASQERTVQGSAHFADTSI